MANKKADNQWYGKGFEQSIVMIKNNLPLINPYPTHISSEQWDDILAHAKIFIVEYERYEKIDTIAWIGNQTKTGCGDLLINGKKVEIKHVFDGTGTYLNTSWENFKNQYGIPLDAKSFLKEYNLYDELQMKFGDKVNMNNISPFSTSQAKVIMKEHSVWYKMYKVKEESARTILVNQAYQYLLVHPETVTKLLYDIITKTISNKEMPDQLVIFNYGKKEITYFSDKQKLIELKNNYKLDKTARQKLGFTLGNFRIQIGWQNGAGLCNPTVRVFIR